MTINPGKVIKQQLVGLAIVMAFFAVLFLAMSPLFGIVVGIIFITLFLPWWIASWRTIVMDEIGCTICFFGYKKRYRWDELKIKRYVDYENCFESRSFADRGAEFCVKNIHIPKGMQSWTYSIFHPLSFFFVYFSPNQRPKDETLCPIIYEVDEVVFRSTLAEWAVDMDEVKRPLF